MKAEQSTREILSAWVRTWGAKIRTIAFNNLQRTLFDGNSVTNILSPTTTYCTICYIYLYYQPVIS